jgi:hypothetical protein
LSRIRTHDIDGADRLGSPNRHVAKKRWWFRLGMMIQRRIRLVLAGRNARNEKKEQQQQSEESSAYYRTRDRTEPYFSLCRENWPVTVSQKVDRHEAVTPVMPQSRSRAL